MLINVMFDTGRWRRLQSVDRSLKLKEHKIKNSFLYLQNCLTFYLDSAMYILFLMRHNISKICIR